MQPKEINQNKQNMEIFSFSITKASMYFPGFWKDFLTSSQFLHTIQL